MSLTTFSFCSQTGSFPRLQTLYFCPLVLGDLRASNTITQGYKYTKESAANTISAIRQWLFFANYFHLPVLPVSADSVVLFLEFMARSSGYGHLKHLVSSLRFLHQALDISFPEVSFQLDMTMQGLKRRLARVPFQVLPITPDILRNMFCLLDMRKMSDLALWCAYLISFYSLLRKSNAVPKSAQFNPSQVLIRKNLSVDLPTNMVYLYLGFSKTNQFGAKDLVVPIPGNDDPRLDPVRHLNELFSRVKAPEGAPAFSFSVKSFITYSTFTTRLKSLLTRVGYDASLYSGHSFRRGGATFLHSCGGTALMVQATGDWSSQCFTRYLYLSFEGRLRSQSLMSENISKTVG